MSIFMLFFGGEGGLQYFAVFLVDSLSPGGGG